MKGWGAQDDFQEQIEQTIADRRAAVQAEMIGEGRRDCEDCGKTILQARRLAYPSCTRCVKCQEKYENA